MQSVPCNDVTEHLKKNANSTFWEKSEILVLLTEMLIVHDIFCKEIKDMEK
jgi:hypothetical protein